MDQITFGMLEQTLVWDNIPKQELLSEVMDSLLPALGNKKQGKPGRLYEPQEGIQAYIVAEDEGIVSDNMIAHGIIIAYSPTLDSENNNKGLDRSQINETCESLADFMGMYYRSESGCIIEATRAKENYPVKPSPRAAFSKVVDFRIMLHNAIDYVAKNMSKDFSIDFPH